MHLFRPILKLAHVLLKRTLIRCCQVRACTAHVTECKGGNSCAYLAQLHGWICDRESGVLPMEAAVMKSDPILAEGPGTK